MAGHMGMKKTKSRILERTIWYNLSNSCEEHVKGLAVCNRQKKGCRVVRGTTVVSCWVCIRTGSY